MELIKCLIFILEVLGLVFVIGIVINLILDVIIIEPIMKRKMIISKAKLFDLIVEKAKNGEDILNCKVDEIEKEIEN